MNKVKFGLETHRYWEYGFIRKVALYAEELGFDCVWIEDHVLPPPFLEQNASCLEAWVAIAAIASETKNIKVGTLVTCNTYRHPSLLAKMAATLDVISRGRLEFAIGTGFNKLEHKAYGIPFPELYSTRVESLRESIQIVRGLWTERKFSFEGKFYKLQDAFCEPKPFQKPHPPIWVGGKGDKLLQIVAEHGDGCNFIWIAPDEYKAKIDRLEHYCEQVGRQPTNIKRSYSSDVLLGTNETSLESKFQKLKDRNVRGISAGFKAKGINLQDFRRGRFVGTPQNCIDQIDAYVRLGVSDFMLIFPELEFDLTCLQFFAEKVMPSFI